MPNDGKPNDRIDYEALQQEALRGVVRAALEQAAATGLQGDQHFYIKFKTKAPGVSGPSEVMARYPDEMPLVFKRDQFRDLSPGDTFFTVILSFGGQPRVLSIPYAAITEFEDPTAPYRLKFDVLQTVAGATPPPLDTDSEASAVVKDKGAPNIVSLDQFRKK